MTEREAQQPLRVVRGVLPVVADGAGGVPCRRFPRWPRRRIPRRRSRPAQPRQPSSARSIAIGRSWSRCRIRSGRSPKSRCASIARRSCWPTTRRSRAFASSAAIAGMPTAFVASYGSGRPVIGDHGRVRRAARAFTEGAAQQGAAGRGRRRSWLRAQHVRRRESRRRACDQGADPGGQRSRARSASTARRPRRTSAARPTWRATACSTTST